MQKFIAAMQLQFHIVRSIYFDIQYYLVLYIDRYDLFTSMIIHAFEKQSSIQCLLSTSICISYSQKMSRIRLQHIFDQCFLFLRYHPSKSYRQFKLCHLYFKQTKRKLVLVNYNVFYSEQTHTASEPSGRTNSMNLHF